MAPDSLNALMPWFALGALIFAMLAAACALVLVLRPGGRALAGEHERILREETARLRGEVSNDLLRFGDSIRSGLGESRAALDARLDALGRAQVEAAEKARFELGQSLSALIETNRTQLAEVTAQLRVLQEQAAVQGETLRDRVEARLDTLRKENEQKLEQMRATVDEKLQGTLEKRLGESFKRVSESLERVYAGLGEMQTLAAGVGDLKRTLTNVKSRGGWAEVQLEMLLDDMLAPSQFEKNAEIPHGSGQRVEFAVRLPGPGDVPDVLLPIDAKFPAEDYARLQDAQMSGERDAVETAAKAVEQAIRTEAKRIRDKYVVPPQTTDFAILYLPTEGLFAEVLRRGTLVRDLQRLFHVTVAGPTTLSAFLNALQMGFRTIAIEQRSHEIARVLAEAKAEFEKYGQVWEKLERQLDTAQRTVKEAGTRTRAVARKLRDVEAVPPEGGTETALPAPDLPLDDEDI